MNMNEKLVTYGVHYKDHKTGKVTRIDIIDVPEDFTANDYVESLEDAGETDILKTYNDGDLSLVRLPTRDSYSLPKEIPADGPQDIV